MVPRVEVDGEELYYQYHEGGEGASTPPLLLLHGAGGNLMHWPRELRRLPGRPVLALDLPGHGHSRGQGRDDIGAYAEVVQRATRALNLAPFVFAGHSMGGGIALAYALRYPEELAGLVLVATGAQLPVTPELLNGVQNDFPATVRRMVARAYANQADPKTADLYARRLLEVGQETFHGDLVACANFDVRDRLAEIAQPALILCGAADRLTHPHYSQELAARLPNARLEIIPGAGHMVMLEQPNAVAALVESAFE